MEGLSRRTPRPFVVVHSGNTATELLGFSLRRLATVVRRELGGGCVSGGANARRMACSKEIRCTFGVYGYDTVKMGSKMAARYSASIGQVKEDAMMDPGCGSRA